MNIHVISNDKFAAKFVGLIDERYPEKSNIVYIYSNEGKKKDIVGYNHAVAKIWFFYAAVLEMIGLPFVFIPQNSIMAVVVMLAIVALTIGIMIVYVKIDAKYKEV